MARLRLDLPDSFVFSAELPVRVSDLNYGGHLGNDSVVTLMQEARVMFYRSLGFDSEIRIEDTVGQIVADVMVEYRSESFLGDILVIEIAAADLSRYSFSLFYRITNKSTGKEAARGKTGIVCFDYAARKVAEVPKALAAKLG